MPVSLEKMHVAATNAASGAISRYMSGVYRWMTAGLLLTGAVAWGIGSDKALVQVLFENSWLVIGMIVLQLALVIALASVIGKMRPGVATACFLGYSALTGATLSVIFLTYSVSAIAEAFFVSAGMFAAMSVYGTVTKRDLSSIGAFCFMGLIGLLIAMIVNLFLASSVMDFVICCVGVVVFTGLTAYDTQKLREFGAKAPDDAEAVHRGAILGALTLYLDFINLFLMLLRLFGMGGRD